MSQERTKLVNKNVAIVRRTVVFNKPLDEAVEKVRQSLGMTRSDFIKYSVMRLLEQLNILSSTAIQEALHPF